jgi:hypothetical protein
MIILNISAFVLIIFWKKAGSAKFTETLVELTETVAKDTGSEHTYDSVSE